MNADGSNRVRLTHNMVIDENPDWSPDGSRIAFYSGRAGNAEVWVINAFTRAWPGGRDEGRTCAPHR